jgi:hypothetical protein
MLRIVAQDWHGQLTLTRSLKTPGSRNAFYSRVKAGEFARVCRGAYVPRELWATSSVRVRHLLRVRAVAALSNEELVFSHYSATALWRLPLVGQWPARVHTVTALAPGGLSNRAIVRHAQGLPGIVDLVDGLNVVGIARTVIEMAAVCPFPAAVAIADAALRRSAHPIDGVPRTLITHDDLKREATGLALRHSSAKVARVIQFADAAADLPGESLSRVNMHVAGIPVPQLQAPLRGASGKLYFVDFWWPQFRLIGEFDGKDKYKNPQYLRGRTPEQALYDEKLREDDLRAAGHGMTRWKWEVAISPTKLAAHLYRAGLR